MTRAVSGCSGETSHRASASRFFGASGGSGGQHGGRAVLDLVRVFVVGAFDEDEGVARLLALAHDHRARRCVFSAASRAFFASSAAFLRGDEARLAREIKIRRPPSSARRCAARARWRARLHVRPASGAAAPSAIVGDRVEPEFADDVLLVRRSKLQPERQQPRRAGSRTRCAASKTASCGLPTCGHARPAGVVACRRARSSAASPPCSKSALHRGELDRLAVAEQLELGEHPVPVVRARPGPSSAANRPAALRA